VVTLRTGLFLGEHGVRFDPCVGLDGRRFLALQDINEATRRLGLPSLFAHLCQNGIKRGEHPASVLESTVAGIRLVTTWTGGLPM
jgi:hypothetical protein